MSHDAKSRSDWELHIFNLNKIKDFIEKLDKTLIVECGFFDSNRQGGTRKIGCFITELLVQQDHVQE